LSTCGVDDGRRSLHGVDGVDGVDELVHKLGCRKRVDRYTYLLRFLIYGLAAIMGKELSHNPFNGALYALTNWRCDKIKLRLWEDSVFVLYKNHGAKVRL
jgi:hypothetical protein